MSGRCVCIRVLCQNSRLHASYFKQGTQDDPLLKSLGFSPSPEGGGRRKRPSEDGDEPPAKKTPLSTLDTLPPVSSSAPGNSKLWEKNKMLASLLAKQPATPTMTHIPPVPASVISATPQDKLPRIIKQQVSGRLSQLPTSGQSEGDKCNRVIFLVFY